MKLWNNSIEMQTHFTQESNRHSVWDTTGGKNLTTKKLPRMAVVPYADVYWISRGGQTSNELRVWLEEIVRNGANFQKDDWEFLFDFSLDLIGFYTYCLLLVFSMFEFISSTQNNKTVEVRFSIPGVSIERQINLRFKPIIESKIGFLL